MAKPVAKRTAKRQLELPTRHWYNPRTWKRFLPLPPRRQISSTYRLFRTALTTLKKAWRTFAGITLVYAFGVFIFVRSFSVGATDSTVIGAGGSGFSGKINEAVSQFATIVSSANASFSAASGVYQIIISTICCLALIWAFRQVLSHEKATVKASFYSGMTPLVKYLLVLAMIGVHLIPVAIGGYLYNIMLSSGMFFGWELWAGGFVFALTAIWSLYLITHAMFALFITTLPDMTPLRALRGAKKMVYRRRLIIWRKLVLGAIAIIIVGALLMLPAVLWWPAGAPWVFFLLSVLLVPIGQAFLYALYREIL